MNQEVLEEECSQVFLLLEQSDDWVEWLELSLDTEELEMVAEAASSSEERSSS